MPPLVGDTAASVENFFVIDERIDALVAELEALSLESDTDEALAATQAVLTCT